jgi:hypothetical protein
MCCLVLLARPGLRCAIVPDRAASDKPAIELSGNNGQELRE